MKMMTHGMDEVANGSHTQQQPQPSPNGRQSNVLDHESDV